MHKVYCFILSVIFWATPLLAGPTEEAALPQLVLAQDLWILESRHFTRAEKFDAVLRLKDVFQNQDAVNALLQKFVMEHKIGTFNEYRATEVPNSVIHAKLEARDLAFFAALDIARLQDAVIQLYSRLKLGYGYQVHSASLGEWQKSVSIKNLYISNAANIGDPVLADALTRWYSTWYEVLGTYLKEDPAAALKLFQEMRTTNLPSEVTFLKKVHGLLKRPNIKNGLKREINRSLFGKLSAADFEERVSKLGKNEINKMFTSLLRNNWSKPREPSQIPSSIYFKPDEELTFLLAFAKKLLEESRGKKDIIEAFISEIEEVRKFRVDRSSMVKALLMADGMDGPPDGDLVRLTDELARDTTKRQEFFSKNSTEPSDPRSFFMSDQSKARLLRNLGNPDQCLGLVGALGSP